MDATSISNRDSDKAQSETLEAVSPHAEKHSGNNVHGAAERGFVATDQ